ncbi:MAG: NADPH:quinone oxidoreductase family protein [Candidatus Nanopelagicales bacterium]
MKAWRVHEFGPYRDALVWEDAPDPDLLGPESSVIQIAAAGVNFPDVLFIQGEYQIKPPLPFIPGIEAVGTVVEVGDSCKYQVGDRIVTSGIGAFAEKMAALDSMTFKVPDAMTDVDAAAIRIIYETSYMAIKYKANMQRGEVLLVHGGAGGVGTSAIQVGKALKGTVIATATGERDIQVCYDTGADYVIDWKSEDIVARVKEITEGKGANVIYDPVGGDAFDASTHCIAFEGRLIVIGFASGRIPEIKAHLILNKNMSVMGFFWTNYLLNRPDLVDDYQKEINLLYLEGKFRPVVSKVLPMTELPETLDHITGRDAYGKIVLVNE